MGQWGICGANSEIASRAYLWQLGKMVSSWSNWFTHHPSANQHQTASPKSVIPVSPRSISSLNDNNPQSATTIRSCASTELGSQTSCLRERSPGSYASSDDNVFLGNPSPILPELVLANPESPSVEDLCSNLQCYFPGIFFCISSLKNKKDEVADQQDQSMLIAASSEILLGLHNVLLYTSYWPESVLPTYSVLCRLDQALQSSPSTEEKIAGLSQGLAKCCESLNSLRQEVPLKMFDTWFALALIFEDLGFAAQGASRLNQILNSSQAG